MDLSVYVLIGLIISGITLAYIIARFLSERKKFKNSPIINERAFVLSKRTITRGKIHNDKQNDRITERISTGFFVTFQFENGDRMEFEISEKRYGVLIENDIGLLTYQYTKLINFERDKIAFDLSNPITVQVKVSDSLRC